MEQIIAILFSQSLLPITMVVGFSLVLLVMGLYRLGLEYSYLLATVGVGLAFFGLVIGSGGFDGVELLTHHGLSVFAGGLVLALTFAILQLSGRFWQTTMVMADRAGQKITPLFHFEIGVLLLLAVAGLLVMVASNHFISLYLGLELSSLVAYFLVSIHRQDSRGNEAALKYYILGSIASAVLLFGMSLLYGMTGTLSLPAMASSIDNQLSQGTEGVMFSLMLGLSLVIVGLAFKVAAAPFHFWAPDVYQGSLSPITAFFATAPKFAALLLLARLLLEYFAPLHGGWGVVIAGLAIASLVFGAFSALTQNNLKRFIALAGVSHVGFLLFALLALPQQEEALVYFLGYLLIYATQTIGLLALLLVLIKVKGGEADNEDLLLSDFAGLGRYQPSLALGMVLLLFSSAGIPPLLGFFAKWWVLIGLLNHGYGIYGIIMVLMSVITATYYLKIIKSIYFDPAAKDGRLFFRQIYEGQQNLIIMGWFWLVVAVQVLLPLFLGRVMDWLSYFQP